MTRRFWCARCGQSCEVPLALAPTLAGRRMRCRSCGHVQPIPQTADAPGPAPAAPIRAPSSYALAPVPEPNPPSPPPAPGPPWPRGQPSSSLSWRDHLRDIATDAGRLQGLSLVLVTLSITDLFVTFHLLRASPRYYE